MRKYKRDQGKPKWKALKRSNVKIQTQAVRGGGKREPRKTWKENLISLKMIENDFYVEPCHVGKIEFHNQHMEHREEPHPYPQGMTLHQKIHESFDEPNQNENLKEAQELKKEGPPLGQKKREKYERMKGGKKGRKKK